VRGGNKPLLEKGRSVVGGRSGGFGHKTQTDASRRSYGGCQKKVCRLHKDLRKRNKNLGGIMVRARSSNKCLREVYPCGTSIRGAV